VTLLRILGALLLVTVLPVGLACEKGKLELPELPKVDLPNMLETLARTWCNCP
jgi:hypothetical protein